MWLGHDPLSRILLVIAVSLAAAAIIQVARYGNELRGILRCLAKADRRVLLLSVLWVAVYVCFLFFWVPANQHYRNFYSAPIVLLLGVILAPAAQLISIRRYRALLVVGALALLNFVFLILPLSHEENMPTLAFAHEMRQFWPPGTVVYYQNYFANVNNWNMRYFNPQTEWRQVPADALPVADPELHAIYASGGTVWFDTSLLDLPQWRTPAFELWLRQHTRPNSLHEIPQKGWHVGFLQIFPAR